MSRSSRALGSAHRRNARAAQMRERLDRYDVDEIRRESPVPIPNRVGVNTFKETKMSNTVRVRAEVFQRSEGFIGLCSECDKTSYARRRFARRAARRLLPGEKFSVYKCGSVYHYGHLPRRVVTGDFPRPETVPAPVVFPVPVRPRIAGFTLPSSQEASATTGPVTAQG